MKVKSKKSLAVIPARGGSKRIPKKNIRAFCGKPMISWAIEKAVKSCLFDTVIVSTDDEEVASISIASGAEVPFYREPSLADDYTPTVPVIADALEKLNELGRSFDYACCIYPCAPSIQVKDLSVGFDVLRRKQCDFVYPVCEYAHPVMRSMKRSSEGRMSFLFPEHELTRTQDLETLYHDAGQFYWGRADAWVLGKKMHTDGLTITIPSWRVVDIDTENDWIRAEMLMQNFFLS